MTCPICKVCKPSGLWFEKITALPEFATCSQLIHFRCPNTAGRVQMRRCLCMCQWLHVLPCQGQTFMPSLQGWLFLPCWWLHLWRRLHMLQEVNDDMFISPEARSFELSSTQLLTFRLPSPRGSNPIERRIWNTWKHYLCLFYAYCSAYCKILNKPSLPFESSAKTDAAPAWMRCKIGPFH